MQLEQKFCKGRRQHTEAVLWKFADILVFVSHELKLLVLAFQELPISPGKKKNIYIDKKQSLL